MRLATSGRFAASVSGRPKDGVGFKTERRAMPRSDLKDITGERFGARVVIEYAGNKKWRTRCDCGAVFVVDGADLRRRAYRCNHIIANRFWAKVEKTDTCWIWIASRDEDGYGTFKLNGRSRHAHVVSWEAANGQVPNGFELDHLCHNRPCVRPDHLEPVTHAENVRRGDLGRVTSERFARERGAA